MSFAIYEMIWWYDWQFSLVHISLVPYEILGIFPALCKSNHISVCQVARKVDEADVECEETSWLCQTIANIWGDKNLFDRLLNCVEVSRGKIFHVIEQLCCSGEILNIHLKLMKSTQHHQSSKKSKLLQLQKSTLQNLSWGQWMMSWESETIWQYVLIMIGPMGHQNVIFSNKSLTVRQSPQIGWHSEYL